MYEGLARPFPDILHNRVFSLLAAIGFFLVVDFLAVELFCFLGLGVCPEVIMINKMHGINAIPLVMQIFTALILRLITILVQIFS
jgi:hypothetical protein